MTFRSATALWATLVVAGCVQPQPVRYSSPFDGPVPYDGTDPAQAEVQPRAPAYVPKAYYSPPGDAADPWGPYIREAAERYQLPEQWVRAIMRQESGGQQQAVSSAGAMGLMQIMPATFEDLRTRHPLGNDPFEPRTNIAAGTAYIREMYNRYGAPSFLAAYNAGPDRLDQYLSGAAPLPDETVNYVAALAPTLVRTAPFTGPLAVYAHGDAPLAPEPTPSSLAAGCDADAAYDPSHPCTPLEQSAVAPAPSPAVPPVIQAAPPVPVSSSALSPPGAGVLARARPVAAPSRSFAESVAAPPPAAAAPMPLPPPPAAVRMAAEPAIASPPLPPRPTQVAVVPPVPPQSAPAAPQARARPATRQVGGWAIQVGAFTSSSLARTMAEGARAEVPGELKTAVVTLPPTPPIDGATRYRARLGNLSADSATTACERLNSRQMPCAVVSPESY